MEDKNFRIQIMNHIAERGIAALVERGCTVGKDVPDPQGILLRSADLHDYPFGDSLLVIARSGAGTNNIPLDACCDKGIVVFNSPGANAAAVKELIICSMVMSSRDVLGSIEWVKSLRDRGDEIPLLVEKGKAAFSGPEQPVISRRMPARASAIPAANPASETGTLPAQATTASRSQITTERPQVFERVSAYCWANCASSPMGEYFLNMTSPSRSV